MTPEQIKECAKEGINAWLLCGRIFRQVFRQVFNDYCKDNGVENNWDNFERCRSEFYVMCKKIREEARDAAL